MEKYEIRCKLCKSSVPPARANLISLKIAGFKVFRVLNFYLCPECRNAYESVPEAFLIKEILAARKAEGKLKEFWNSE